MNMMLNEGKYIRYSDMVVGAIYISEGDIVMKTSNSGSCDYKVVGYGPIKKPKDHKLCSLCRLSISIEEKK